MKYTSEKEVCKDALAIYENSACNPAGISLTLHEACCFLNRQEKHGTEHVQKHPAVTLILFQLAYLNGLIFIYSEKQEKLMDEAKKYCKEKASLL